MPLVPPFGGIVTNRLRVLFLCTGNSCRSQMAEAIAQGLGSPHFIFSSAGLDPAAPDPVTLAFLREKGLDVSRLTSKAVNQVPNLEHYQIIVALAKEAEKVFPRSPTKTVCLDWSVPDPSQVEGTPAEIRAAYEGTYAFLQSHIRDLVGAVTGEGVH